MVDIAVMGINMNASLEDFENADFAYAPPFSTAIHPFVQAVYVLLNKIDGTLTSMTPAEYLEGKADDYRILDVNLAPSIPGADYINLAEVNQRFRELKKMKSFFLCVRKAKEVISFRTV